MKTRDGDGKNGKTNVAATACCPSPKCLFSWVGAWRLFALLHFYQFYIHWSQYSLPNRVQYPYILAFSKFAHRQLAPQLPRHTCRRHLDFSDLSRYTTKWQSPLGCSPSTVCKQTTFSHKNILRLSLSLKPLGKKVWRVCIQYALF